MLEEFNLKPAIFLHTEQTCLCVTLRHTDNSLFRLAALRNADRCPNQLFAVDQIFPVTLAKVIINTPRP